MFQNYNDTILKSLVDVVVFLEFASEKIVDPDVSVELIEQISHELQQLSTRDKEAITKKIKLMSEGYEKEKKKFVRDLPENLGLVD